MVDASQSNGTPDDNRIDGVAIGESPVPGLTLRHTLGGFDDTITRIKWSPDGDHLAVPSVDGTIRIWQRKTGRFEQFAKCSSRVRLRAVAWSPNSRRLALSLDGKHIELWDLAARHRIVQGPAGAQPYGIAWSPDGSTFTDGERIMEVADGKVSVNFGKPAKVKASNDVYDASWSADGRFIAVGTSEGFRLVDAKTGTLVHQSPLRAVVPHVDWSPDGRFLAAAFFTSVNCISIWDVEEGREAVRLEGHTRGVNSVSFSHDGRLLASKSGDGTVRMWRCDSWSVVTSFAETTVSGVLGNLAFHPSAPILATLGKENRVVRIWDVDIDLLLKQTPTASPEAQPRYTTAKVVLIGDSGVGKTGLGWRLAHGDFKDHPSTHGQQFWMLEQLRTTRTDGTQCEAILWDLAGQQDYRLIHALFLDDADLALVLFDPTDGADPLHGVAFWLKHLGLDGKGAGTPAVLVAARSDRGSAMLTPAEIDEFWQARGLRGFVATSALKGDGIDDLLDRVKTLIPWEQKVATVTTNTFKRVKDYVLQLKETTRNQQVIVALDDLRRRLESTDPGWRFTDDEMLGAVGHLENHGYVKRLRTSSGDPRILLVPELLNNLAASLILEARRNPRGLGALDERQLLSGDYRIPELGDISDEEGRILLDAAVLLVLEHNICFRETDPLTTQSYLVFPDLINLKKPAATADEPLEEGPAYTVSGAVQNVYASLVVLLGYTRQLTRTNQWQNQARYEIGKGLICGFRSEAERDGERDFVLYFGAAAGAPVRTLFQSLFESFLARQGVTVARFDPVKCSRGHSLNRAVVRDYVAQGKAQTFCNECGEQIALKTAEPIELTRAAVAQVDEERQAAAERTEFEQAIYQLQAFVTQQQLPIPECFISYAWGNREHERWVERELAADLQKAGLTVLLDRWDNARIGASVSRFVDRVSTADRVLVVGTPTYRMKYENKTSMGGYVAAAEGDLIGNRMLRTEEHKESVLPLLLEGDPRTAFPPLLEGRVFADFRDPASYFAAMFDVILSLYEIPVTHQAVSDLRISLRKPSDPGQRRRR